MSTVKAWEALKAWQETRQRCRPVGAPYKTKDAFQEPAMWYDFTAYEFILEPPKPMIVVFESDAQRTTVEFKDGKGCPAVTFIGADPCHLDGKRWRCVCTEIIE